MGVRIMTDSASDITIEELEKYRITLIPMTLQCGNDTIIDNKTIPTERLWQYMEAGVQIRTSQPAPGTFENAFSEAVEAGDEVVCILISSALSGTCQTAILGKSMVEGEIHIVDCTCAAASVAEKMVVFEACRLRDEGRSAKDIAVRLASFRSRVRLIACLNTLDYLARGGRINRTMANIGAIAHVKPIITLSDKGEVKLLAKTIGSRHAMKAMVTEFQKAKLAPAIKPIPIFSRSDVNCLTYMHALADAGITELDEQQGIGATIGAYIGPDAYGIVYVLAE